MKDCFISHIYFICYVIFLKHHTIFITYINNKQKVIDRPFFLNDPNTKHIYLDLI